MKKKNHWDQRKFKMINWTTHNAVVCKKYEHNNFFFKYIHNCLPGGEHISKYSPQYPIQCPSCPYIVKDQYHVLRCPERKKLQKALLHK